MKPRKRLVASLLAGVGLALALGAASRARARKPARKATHEAIDGYVEAQMRRLHIPGGALAVVEGRRIVHWRGLGWARPGGEIPTSKTPFFIGSLTKSITALAVMQLVEAGKVGLDAPVQRYLPWFRVADPQASAQMTVRHLLNQTSGLPWLPSEIAFDLDDGSPEAAERLVRSLATLKLNGPVGGKCEYSNFNYDILGLVVEAASGKRYADYIQGQIFDPLGMRHSYASKARAREDGLAVGHRHWFSLPVPAPDMHVPVGSLASGYLISCAEDMARYLIAHLNGGRYGDAQILSSAGMDELHRGATEFKMFGVSAGKYGMGWFEDNLGATKTYSHGGNVPDFSAFMAIIPEQKQGLVLLLNADPYGLPIVTEEVGIGATALLVGQQPGPIKLDFIQWIMRLLPLIPLLQMAGVFAALRRLRRVRTGTARLRERPSLIPLAPDLALVGLLAYLQSSGLIRFLDLFMPDLAWIARTAGGLAGISAVLRTRLALRALRSGN